MACFDLDKEDMMDMSRYYIWSVCLFCLLTLTAEAQNSRKRVVDCPGFVTANTAAIEIRKIILTDEQTQVDAVMYGDPGTPAVISSETCLNTDKGAVRLREAGVVSIDGITEPELIPESGRLNVVLSFAPVPSDVHEVDFVEPETGWRIWGIQLSRKEPYVYVPAFLTMDKPVRDNELPEPGFSVGKSIVNGYMLGYEPDMELSAFVEFSDGIFPSPWKENVHVHQDGSFHFEADLLQPTLAVLHVNEASQCVMLVPGEEFTMYVSLPRLSMSASRLLESHYRKRQKAWFDGAAELINTEMASGRNSPALKAYQVVENGLMHNEAIADKVKADVELVRPVCERLANTASLTSDDRKQLEKVQIGEIRDYILLKEKDMRVSVARSESMKEAVVAGIDASVAGADILPAIISSQKGHAVLIDFWATWCGPCKKSMKAIQPLKKNLEGKDVVYVYITGPSSPEHLWKADLAEMTGVHYRLTENQWKYLCAAYGITAIPAYLVISHDGKLQRRYVGFPGVDELQKELLRALGE